MKMKKEFVQFGVLAGAFILGSMYGRDQVNEKLNRKPNTCLEDNLPCA
jgi:hypothetical protein